MLIEPTRYRQRPPEVDALLVLDDTTDAALAWLRSWNRDAYVTTDGLRVVDQGPDGAPGFDVPFGTYLIRDIRTGGWAPVPSSTLEAEYVSAREAARRERGYM